MSNLRRVRLKLISCISSLPPLSRSEPVRPLAYSKKCTQLMQTPGIIWPELDSLTVMKVVGPTQQLKAVIHASNIEPAARIASISASLSSWQTVALYIFWLWSLIRLRPWETATLALTKGSMKCLMDKHKDNSRQRIRYYIAMMCQKFKVTR